MNDLHSLAGEYALGGLSDEETQQFETHLETCPDCREEVAAMREIAVQLSEGVATDPPPTLRASVLQQIAETAQDSADSRPALVATPDEQEGGRHLPEGASSAEGAGTNVVPLQRSVQRRNRLVGLLAAAAVVVAIAMGGWAVQSRNDADQATAQAQQAAQKAGANSTPSFILEVDGKPARKMPGTVNSDPSAFSAELDKALAGGT